MHGFKSQALEHACKCNLWGYAFALANYLGQNVFRKVMTRFFSQAIFKDDPILTYFQLAGGEIPQMVESSVFGRSEFF